MKKQFINRMTIQLLVDLQRYLKESQSGQLHPSKHSNLLVASPIGSSSEFVIKKSKIVTPHTERKTINFHHPSPSQFDITNTNKIMEMPQENPQESNRRSVLQLLKAKYDKLQSMVAKLDKMTHKYVQSGPLAKLKEQMKHADFILLRTLTENVDNLEDSMNEKLYSRSKEQAEKIQVLIAKCQKELRRLTHNPDKMIFRKNTDTSTQSPSPQRSRISLNKLSRNSPPRNFRYHRTDTYDSTKSIIEDQDQSREICLSPSALMKEESKQTRDSSRSILLKSTNDKMFEGLAADCFMNFVEAMNLTDYYRREKMSEKSVFKFIVHNVQTDRKVLDYIRTFQVFKESVELHKSVSQEDAQLLSLIQSPVIAFSFEQQTLRLASHDTKSLKDVKSEVSQYVEMKRQGVEYLDISDAQATTLNLLLSRGTTLDDMFNNDQVAAPSKNPVTKKWRIPVGCSQEEKASSLSKIKRITEHFCSSSLIVSDSIVTLLHFRKQIQSKLTVLQDMEQKHGCGTELSLSSQNSGNLLELHSQQLGAQSKGKEEKLSLKIDDNQSKTYQMKIYSSTKEGLSAFKEEVTTLVQTLDQERKYFQIEEVTDQPRRKNSMAAMYRSTMTMRNSGKASWEQIVAKLGAQKNKTDFCLNFQRDFNVLLYAYQGTKYKGILIYGQQSNQRLAFVELGSLFQFTSLKRNQVPLGPTLGRLMDSSIVEAILKKLRERHSSAELFMHSFEDERFAVLYSQPMLSFDALQTLEDQINEEKSKLIIKTLPSEYQLVKQYIPQILKSLNKEVIWVSNPSHQSRVVYLPKFERVAIWKFAQLGSKLFIKYETDKSQEIENNYQMGQERFMVEEGNFSLCKDKEQEWCEETDLYKFKVKRVQTLVQSTTERVEAEIPAGGLVLIGYPKIVERVQSQLKKRIGVIQSESKKWPLDFYYEQESGYFVGEKYGVRVKKLIESGMVQILGEKANEAYLELKRLSGLRKEEANLRQSSKEFQRVALNFIRGWKAHSSNVVKVLKITKIFNQKHLSVFTREKNELKEQLGNESQHVIVYKAEGKSGFEIKCSRNPAFFERKISQRGGCFSILLCKGLLGKVLNSDESEERVVPPTITSEIG